MNNYPNRLIHISLSISLLHSLRIYSNEWNEGIKYGWGQKQRKAQSLDLNDLIERQDWITAECCKKMIFKLTAFSLTSFRIKSIKFFHSILNGRAFNQNQSRIKSVFSRSTVSINLL